MHCLCDMGFSLVMVRLMTVKMKRLSARVTGSLAGSLGHVSRGGATAN
jgi:hypothetical protein